MQLTHFVYIIPIILFLQLAAWVLYIDKRAAVNWLMAVMCTLLAFETAIHYYYCFPTNLTTTHLLGSLQIFIWGLVIILFVYFAILLVAHPVLSKRKWRIMILILNIPMLLNPIFLLPVFNEKFLQVVNPYISYYPNSPFLIYYNIVSIAMLVITLYVLSYARFITTNYRIQKLAMLNLKAFMYVSLIFVPVIVGWLTWYNAPESIVIYGELLFFFISVYSLARYREQSLSTSRILTEMIEHASDFTMILSPTKQIISINKQTRKFLGYDKYEIEGKHISFLLDYESGLKNELNKATSRPNYSPQLDLNIKLKSGQISVLKTGINAIRNQFNEILGFYLIFYGESAEVNSIDSLQIKHDLTNREKEVAMLLVKGLTKQNIADTLFVSLATVKTHSHNIYQKTGAKNKLELRNLLA